MRVPTSQFNKWRIKYQHGDVAKIAEQSNISRQTISRALNGGSCDQSTIDAIENYYSKKITP